MFRKIRISRNLDGLAEIYEEENVRLKICNANQ